MVGIREIAKGHDGWYFDHIKIEPTEEEIQQWNNQWCNFCCIGTIFSKNKKEQIPCPKCLGSGLKKENTHFEWASHGVVDKISGWFINPETYGLLQKIQVSFNLNESGQQDGRESNKEYTRMVKMYYIGKTILEAIEKQ